MARNIESRIAELEDSIPRGYTTFDGNGKPVIQSDLPALEWYMEALALLRSRGREAAKERLRAQLAASVDVDNAGGYLYQMLAALAVGPVD
jgi:hypothetical protein